MYKYISPYLTPCMNCFTYSIHFTQEDFGKVLNLINEIVQNKINDELLYDYLISLAPIQEEKDIIISIRNDARSHQQWFIEMYRYYTGMKIQSTNSKNFIRPSSYIKGISEAIFGELIAIEKYRFIRDYLPNIVYRDLMFRVLADEIKNITKYNYILNKNSNIIQSNNMETRKQPNYKNDFSKKEGYLSTQRDYYSQTKEFTLSELIQYDGTMGKPAYVAVNGIVYDVSNISKWIGGKHYGLTAGNDLTSQFETCHGIESKLANLPKVGVLKM